VECQDLIDGWILGMHVGWEEMHGRRHFITFLNGYRLNELVSGYIDHTILLAS
jgi:hypothetical protein